MASDSTKRIRNIFYDLVKQQILLHRQAIKNLTTHYMFSNIDELKKIYTKKEIDNITYLPFNSVKYYFLAITKNNYNLTELTVISVCIYNNMLSYLNLIGLLFTSIQNYYGRGKVILDLDNTEEFINQVIITQTKRNFNPDKIRSHIKTVKIMKMVVLNIIKVFDENIITVLETPFREIFEAYKGQMLNSIKALENNTDFKGNLEDIKKKFKIDNKNVYKSIIGILDSASNFNHCMIFSLIYDPEIDDLTENPSFVHNTYKKEFKNLVNFVKHPDFNLTEIINDISFNIIAKKPMYNVLKYIYENSAMYNFIKANESNDKLQVEQEVEETIEETIEEKLKGLTI